MCMALKRWNLSRLVYWPTLELVWFPAIVIVFLLVAKSSLIFYRTYSTDMFWVVFLLGVKCSYLKLVIESRILKHPRVDTVGFALVFTLEYPPQCQKITIILRLSWFRLRLPSWLWPVGILCLLPNARIRFVWSFACIIFGPRDIGCDCLHLGCVLLLDNDCVCQTI